MTSLYAGWNLWNQINAMYGKVHHHLCYQRSTTKGKQQLYSNPPHPCPLGPLHLPFPISSCFSWVFFFSSPTYTSLFLPILLSLVIVHLLVFSHVIQSITFHPLFYCFRSLLHLIYLLRVSTCPLRPPSSLFISFLSCISSKAASKLCNMFSTLCPPLLIILAILVFLLFQSSSCDWDSLF